VAVVNRPPTRYQTETYSFGSSLRLRVRIRLYSNPTTITTRKNVQQERRLGVLEGLPAEKSEEPLVAHQVL